MSGAFFPLRTESPPPCKKYVEHQSKIYEVNWDSNLPSPDLSKFPDVANVSAVKLPLSREMEDLLKNSRPVCLGSNAWLRSTNKGVVKAAYPFEDSRAQVRYELHLLRKLSKESLPVPKVKEGYLADGEGVFGFVMEHLYEPLSVDDHATLAEIARSASQLHGQRIVHRNLSLKKLMRDEDGRPVLIGFGYAGFCDSVIPDFKKPATPGQHFHCNMDDDQICKICVSLVKPCKHQKKIK